MNIQIKSIFYLILSLGLIIFFGCAKTKDFPNFTSENLNKFQKIEKKSESKGDEEGESDGKNNFTDFNAIFDLEGTLIDKPNVKAKFTLSSENRITNFMLEELVIDGLPVDTVTVEKTYFDNKDNITFYAFLSTYIIPEVLQKYGIQVKENIPTKIKIIAKFSKDYKDFKTEKFEMKFSGLDDFMKGLLEKLVSNAFCTAHFISGTLPTIIDPNK